MERPEWGGWRQRPDGDGSASCCPFPLDSFYPRCLTLLTRPTQLSVTGECKQVLCRQRTQDCCLLCKQRRVWSGSRSAPGSLGHQTSFDQCLPIISYTLRHCLRQLAPSIGLQCKREGGGVGGGWFFTPSAPFHRLFSQTLILINCVYVCVCVCVLCVCVCVCECVFSFSITVRKTHGSKRKVSELFVQGFGL